jgi:hypothetical protein
MSKIGVSIAAVLLVVSVVNEAESAAGPIPGEVFSEP